MKLSNFNRAILAVAFGFVALSQTTFTTAQASSRSLSSVGSGDPNMSTTKPKTCLNADKSDRYNVAQAPATSLNVGVSPGGRVSGSQITQ